MARGVARVVREQAKRSARSQVIQKLLTAGCVLARAIVTGAKAKAKCESRIYYRVRQQSHPVSISPKKVKRMNDEEIAKLAQSLAARALRHSDPHLTEQNASIAKPLVITTYSEIMRHLQSVVYTLEKGHRQLANGVEEVIVASKPNEPTFCISVPDYNDMLFSCKPTFTAVFSTGFQAKLNKLGYTKALLESNGPGLSVKVYQSLFQGKDAFCVEATYFGVYDEFMFASFLNKWCFDLDVVVSAMESFR